MTTYYVSSEIGSDNNAGTSATSPLASLQAAADLVKPGDTVEVMNGTYTGNAPGGGDVVDITTSGTASAPITFEAAPGQTPVINSSGGWNAINIEASYIVVKGFTVVGDAANYTLSQALAAYSTGNANLDGNGISVNSPGNGVVPNHITIENNTVYNEPGGGIGTGGADYLQILNNVVYDNAHWSAFGNSGISVAVSSNSDTNAGVHDIISGNTVFGNAQLVPTTGGNTITDGEGIILDTNPGFVGEILVENNTVYNNGSAGIESFLTDNAVITQNTVYGNDTGNVQPASDAEILINQSNNNTVTNNTTTAPNLTPPAAPVISGDTVNYGNTVTLNGTAEGGSTITVFDNSTKLGTTVTNTSGAWTFATGALANGSQSFTATATDSAGNVSSLSSPLAVTLNIPVNLVANGNFATGDFTDWTLGGNYTSGQIFIDTNGEGGSTYAAGLGSMGADGTLSQTIPTTSGETYTLSFWLRNEGSTGNDFKAIWNGQTLLSLTNAAQSGYTEYTYTVTATGSTSTLEFSAANAASQWDLDNISLAASKASTTPPPAVPGISTGAENSNQSVTLTGTAPAGSTVTVSDGGASALGTATANSSTGAWSFTTAALSAGPYAFTATDTTSAGTSAASSPFDLTVTSSSRPPPAAPVIKNGAENSDLSVTLTGTAPDGSTVTVSDGGASALGTATANSSTDAWSFTTAALSAGSYAFTATDTTSAGTSAASSPFDLTVTSSSPPPPAAPVIKNGAENSDLSVTLTGTAPDGSIVTVSDGGASALGTVTANSSTGAWSFTTAALSAGSYAFTATDTTSAGTSAASSPFDLTVTSSSTPSTGPNLVANGNFATGDFTDWTLGGNTIWDNSLQEIFIDTNAEGGSTYAAGMGSMGSDGTLSQTIATTAGQTYTLSFWLQNEESGGNDFNAMWNGQTLLSLTNATQFGYTEYTYTVTATGSTSTLEFAAQQNPSQWDLDNVSLTANGTTSSSPLSVSSIAESPTSGDPNAGKTVTLTLKMSENVTVNTAGGKPTLTLNDGGTATYKSGSGTNALIFSYTVAAGQNTPDLSVTKVSLNGANITNGANPANLSLTGLTQTGPQIDTKAPTVSSVVKSPSSGDLGAGKTVTLTLDMSENVMVDTAGGRPTLTLNDGGIATYKSGSGTSALIFTYTVAAGQNTPDLSVTKVNLNGATITNGGNAANLSLTGLTQTGPQIDTTTLTSPPTDSTTKVIQKDGSTSLTEVSNHYYLYGSRGSGPALKHKGADVTAGEFGKWTPIGAVKTAGGYDVAWKNTSNGEYTVWSTDRNGNYKGNLTGGAVSGTSVALESLEPIFHQDLNHDGVIGLVRKVIQSDGSTTLTEAANNYYLDGSRGTGPALKYKGADVTAGEFGKWTPIGAVKTAGGYDVAWKNTGSGQYTVWSIGNNGNYKGNFTGGAVSGTSVALESLEPIFHQDLNHDGVMGLYVRPDTTLEIGRALVGSSGSATIGTGATLELAAADSAAVTFAGSTGTLRLNHSSTFHGKISKFAGNGSLSGSDHIDLRDIKYSSVHDSYSNGVLTVTDGKGDAAKLSLNGSYRLANFRFANDGSGGTIVYDPPVTSSSGQNTATSQTGVPPATTGAGETLDLAAANAAPVKFAPSTGTSEVLSGFGAKDGMDPPGTSLNAQSTLGYLPNGNQADGILSFANGPNANIALLGNYMASMFAMASHNHGTITPLAEVAQNNDQSVLSSPHHA